MLPLIGAGIGAVGSLVGGLINSGNQKKANEENLAFQKEQYAYNKQLQQQMFAREDNAVQRRVTDLKNSGLSPVLAAGSAANAGAPISTTAPQRQATQFDTKTISDAGQSMLNAITARNNTSSTNAQNALIDSQKSKLRAEELETLARTQAIGVSSKQVQATTQKLIKDLEITTQTQHYNQERGQAPSNSWSSSTGPVGAVMSGSSLAVQQAKNTAKNMADNSRNKQPQVSTGYNPYDDASSPHNLYRR